MIFSIPSVIYVVFGYLLLFSPVSVTAYEINVNGQRFQVNVLSQNGERYHDRIDFTDDFGERLDVQPHAICSSLRGEQCQQVTNNGAKTPNLFNYFPTHSSQSVVAQANHRYNTNQSPHLLRQAMNDRILHYLSRQNPHNLGTKPLTPMKSKAKQPLKSQLKLVKSKTIKHKRKEVDVELYSALTGDEEEVAAALGLDEEELGETVDRIVAQLVAQYMDNDSEEVDVGQIFATEMSVENGDVSMEQITLDEGSMEEISELLNSIANQHKKQDGDGTDGDVESEEAHIFALKFKVDNVAGDQEGNGNDNKVEDENSNETNDE